MRKALVLCLLTALALSAQTNPKPKLAGEDWEQIFNGKDLNGWTSIGNEKWEVIDGVIHGSAISKKYGYLMTDKKYKDFHLTLKFKCEGDGNSGVFFHSAFPPNSVDISQGLQFEIDCVMMRHTAGIYGDGRAWIVWPSPENESVVRRDDWNEYLLKVENNHYVARLNGVTMIDFTDPNPKSFDGGIALQLHSGGRGNMKFKDIWIRDLSKR